MKFSFGVIGVLVLLLAAVSAFAVDVIDQRAALEANAKGMQLAAEHWQDEYNTQADELRDLNWNLAAREIEKRRLENEHSDLIRRLHNAEQDAVVKAYMDTVIPDAVLVLMRDDPGGDGHRDNLQSPTDVTATGLRDAAHGRRTNEISCGICHGAESRAGGLQRGQVSA